MTSTISALNQKKPSRILVIQLRHHGDILLITPVISVLKQNYPQSEIDVLLYEETRDILLANPEIAQIHGIDRRWKKLGKRQQLRYESTLLRTLRQRNYDIVVNLADQWRSAIITALTGASVRIGFDFPKRQNALWRWCHTNLVSTDDHGQKHTVEKNLSALAPLGLITNNINATMSYTPEDWQACQRLLPEEVQQNYIVIQPTSRWFFKCWREENMSQVANELSLAGKHIIFTSGPDVKEIEMIDKILSGCTSSHITSLAGKLTLRQLAALIDHAQLFIGVDSAPMHMAAALKTPLVALFGPSKLVFWHPWQAEGEVLWAGDYGPLPDPDDIDTHTQERYLDLIPVDHVIAAAKRLLP